MSEQYVWSTDEERFFSHEYDSREDALAEGRSEEPGAVIYTGIVRRVTVGELARGTFSLDGQGVIEAMGEAAYDIVGEAADSWGDGIPNEAADDLTERLIDEVLEWAETHGIVPKFFAVEKIEEHDAADWLEGL